MNLIYAIVLTAAAGYLLGSINWAIIISRALAHDDIRVHGSGNAGSTNMFRTFGRKAGLLTALGDLLKAVVAVWLGRAIFRLFAVQFASNFSIGHISLDTLSIDPGYLAGLFVLIGHIFPAFFGFKGGKGVMPAVGIILAVNTLAFAVMVMVALPVFLITRTMSLVSIVSSIALPIVTFGLGLLRQIDQRVETGITLVYAILVIISHRENIKRLLRGTEKPVMPRCRK